MCGKSISEKDTFNFFFSDKQEKKVTILRSKSDPPYIFHVFLMSCSMMKTLF